MPALIDLTGQTFHGWKVIERNNNTSQRNPQWICRCQCGVIKSIDGGHLRRGNTRQCRSCVEWKPKDGIPISSKQWHAIQYNAKIRNIKFQLTRQQVYSVFQKQHGKCALTDLNIRLYINREPRSYGTASLDRIDSSKGYTKTNIQWVHKDINRMKSDLPEDKFIYYCSLISQYRS